MRSGKNNIVNKIETEVTLANGQLSKVTWFQFKIPVRDYEKRIGSIRDFKSIRFMRMFMTNFKDDMHLRFGTLELVRGEWRGYHKDLFAIDNPPTSIASIDVTSVNIEENDNKEPVNYVLPPGISRQTDPGQAQLIAQNEQAMVFRVHELAQKDARAVYKNVVYDMRQHKRLQMFVHAECLPHFDQIQDKDITCFIRIGSDLKNN